MNKERRCAMSKKTAEDKLQQMFDESSFVNKDVQRIKIQQLKKHCESLSDQNIDYLIDLAKSWKQVQQ